MLAPAGEKEPNEPEVKRNGEAKQVIRKQEHKVQSAALVLAEKLPQRCFQRMKKVQEIKVNEAAHPI